MPQTETVLSLDPHQIKIGWRARTSLQDVAELAKSIEECGQMQPIVVSKNGEGYTLIAGHRRLVACQKLGRLVKAVEGTATSEAEALWQQLAENAQRVQFDKLELGEILKRHKEAYEREFPEAARGKVGSGKKHRNKAEAAAAEGRPPAEPFVNKAAAELNVGKHQVQKALRLAEKLTADEKKRIRSIPSAKERAKAQDKALSELNHKKKLEAIKEKAAARRRVNPASGDRSRFDLGDNAEVLKEYQDAGYSFDVCLTDPPYQLEWNRIEHTIRADLNAAPSWDDLDVGWIFRVAPLMADPSAMIIFSPAEAIGVYQEALHEAGFKYRGHIVWHKSNPAPQHRPGYIQATEFIVWATKGRPYFRPHGNAGTRAAHNVLELPACGGAERLGHPTQKPVKLLKKILRRHAAPGSVVLDPFAGVGSTLVACRTRDLQVCGIEINPEYHELGEAWFRSV